jgi:hypothetical protein
LKSCICKEVLRLKDNNGGNYLSLPGILSEYMRRSNGWGIGK